MFHEAVFFQESFSLESFPSQEHPEQTWDTTAAVDFLLSVVNGAELIFFLWPDSYLRARPKPVFMF